ncbi:hypothetical protein RHSIM_Rhsim05G0202000 [Rhododendron simsii]|uniref:laccase n=1 Tax=Rhododendron simsii TaxID=118357 RepID=A0A834H0S0_RHOSS|nr:hypothetical protein RHSIM_Rhsim05G0202000 [Rhododendron simsii]
MDIENQALADGHGPNISEAFTINGQPGDLYNCSFGTYKLKVVQGKTYLLRIINVALYSELFFTIANHTMTVVAIDACYTNPMVTDVMVISPGQTIDVLLTADQPLASYYMAAHYYDSLGSAYDATTTTAIITYENATPSTPLMPILPAVNDTSAAFKFYSSLTSLVNGPHWAPVPLKIDEEMFLTEGLGLVPCGANNTCGAPLGLQFAASMNNESFELPTKLSMLEASFYNLTSGIYTTDFPKYPPVVFDYTNTSNKLNTALIMTSRSTKVTKLKFDSTVEIVFQNTALVGKQSHPIHLHGYNFYVLAQGFGNYDPVNGPKMFNLVNPQKRNTVAVPVAGWTVIRFTANNPETPALRLDDANLGILPALLDHKSNPNEPSSRFPNLKEVNPDFGLGEPLGFGKLAFSSTASGWSRPRLVKLRKPKGRMETGKDDSGFNPLNTNVENSSGFVGNRILDAMGKLRFGSDQLRIPCVFKGIGIDKNAVSKLPQEIGVWLMHCHFDSHLSWGLATAFIVDDGPTPSTSLPPPPPDLPLCSSYAKQRRFFSKGGGNAETIFVYKRIVFAWFGSWPGFLVPCFIVFVWFSCTKCKAQYSFALKFWH